MSGNLPMRIEKIAAYTNFAVGALVLLFLTIFAYSFIDPLLYFSDRSHWYSGAAVKLPLFHDERYRLLEKALEINQENEEAQINFAFYQAYEFGDPSGEKGLISVYKSNSTAYSESALILLSNLYLQRCQSEKAWNVTIQGLNAFPTDGAFYVSGAVLLIEEGNMQKAGRLVHAGITNAAKDNSIKSTLSMEKLRMIDAFLSGRIDKGFEEGDFSTLELFWLITTLESCGHIPKFT